MTKEDEANEDAPEITAEQWGAMARSLKQRALALTEAGRLRQAEQALRLAERYDRMQASAPQPKPERDGDYYRNELIRKLTRLQQHLLKQQDEAELKPGEAFSSEPRADAHREALGIKPLPPEYGG